MRLEGDLFRLLEGSIPRLDEICVAAVASSPFAERERHQESRTGPARVSILLSLEGAGDDLDVVGSEGDDVKADVAVVGASGQVVMGSRYDSLLLWRCDRLGRFPMGSTRAVTDFDENQRFAHFCNKIDFADATTEVAIDDSIASLAQKLRRTSFGRGSG